MKIMWLSKHEILPSQLKGLQKKFGTNIEIAQDINPFSSVDDIIQRYNNSDCDDIAIVAPWTIIELMCKRGVHPLWAEMYSCPKNNAEVVINNRGYKFNTWKRVKRIKIEFEDEPTPA